LCNVIGRRGKKEGKNLVPSLCSTTGPLWRRGARGAKGKKKRGKKRQHLCGDGVGHRKKEKEEEKREGQCACRRRPCATLQVERREGRKGKERGPIASEYTARKGRRERGKRKEKGKVLSLDRPQEKGKSLFCSRLHITSGTKQKKKRKKENQHPPSLSSSFSFCIRKGEGKKKGEKGESFFFLLPLC